MRTYNLAFLVEGEKDITFKSIYAHIDERENRLFCSLEGEYLKKNRPFDPPMRYKMSDVGVTTKNVVQIVTPIYRSLSLERSLGSKG
ncbi:MAG: hypothetical protein Q7S55_04235 [Nanoarchaeota archaeon]|nr:hypothetical protein [Nanoarchaeota archaeon]